jgi:hypothetical protein
MYAHVIRLFLSGVNITADKKFVEGAELERLTVTYRTHERLINYFVYQDEIAVHYLTGKTREETFPITRKQYNAILAAYEVFLEEKFLKSIEESLG